MSIKAAAFWRMQDGRVRALAVAAFATAACGMLAALPTAPARAAAPSISGLPSGEVEEVLGQTPLSDLNVPELAEVLAQLHGFEGINLATAKKAIEEAIDVLKGEGATLEELLNGGKSISSIEGKLKSALGPLSGLLETLLGGNPATKITEALGSTDVTELLGKQLGAAAEPEKLIAQLLGALNPEALKGLLGTELTGEPFSKVDVKELAGELEMTAATLATDVGKSTSDLPETAAALTGPLTDGKDLVALNGLEGVTLGLVEKAGSALGGGSGGSGGGGSGGSGSSGGAGGTGGAGASGSGGGTTVTVLSPGGTTGPSATTSASSSKTGKLEIVSHHVDGRIGVIDVSVPSAGKLALGGKNIRSLRRETAKAEHVTVDAVFNKSEAASLSRRHRSMRVPVKVSFKQTGGPSSSVVVYLTFR